jgi:hypothetical protein
MSKKTETVEGKRALTVKEAVAKATDEAIALFGREHLIDLALEEVEMSEDGQFWLVTLGFYRPSKKPVSGLEALRQIQGVTHERKYKLFKVDAATGKVTSMKIRSV